MKKIFVISRYLLFQRGLEQLLEQNTGLTIIGQAELIESAIEQIKELKPNVVVFDTSATDSFAEDIIQLLLSLPQIPIIGLSLQDNQLHLFRSESRSVTTVDDLVFAVKQGTLSKHDNALLNHNPIME